MKLGMEVLTIEQLYKLDHAIGLALYENENYHSSCYLQDMRRRVNEEIELQEK